jgi:hypothetical protein
VQRHAGLAIPQHGGLSLIGDADGEDIYRIDASGGRSSTGKRRLPYFRSVMLYPSVRGIYLAYLDGMLRYRSCHGIEKDRTAGRGSLIDRENKGRLEGHFSTR